MVDAKKCKTVKSFYSEVAQALSFPSLFSHNPDSFRDILEEYDVYTDTMTNLRLILINAEHLFADEHGRSSMLTIHFRIFEIVAKRWQSTESWDEDDRQLYTFEVDLVPSKGSEGPLDLLAEIRQAVKDHNRS
jgi:RNAse (barnase) inhibitor barstar